MLIVEQFKLSTLKMRKCSISFRMVMITTAFLSVIQTMAQNNPNLWMYPPMGKLVDVGGHLLHINAIGKGGPAVVMESGSGDFSFIWSLVQPR